MALCTRERKREGGLGAPINGICSVRAAVADARDVVVSLLNGLENRVVIMKLGVPLFQIKWAHRSPPGAQAHALASVQFPLLFRYESWQPCVFTPPAVVLDSTRA